MISRSFKGLIKKTVAGGRERERGSERKGTREGELYIHVCIYVCVFVCEDISKAFQCFCDMIVVSMEVDAASLQESISAAGFWFLFVCYHGDCLESGRKAKSLKTCKLIMKYRYSHI